MASDVIHDLVVVGGGPAGATAAHDAARAGMNVVLLDRAGRIKPCGGAIPPRCVRDFDIPAEQLVARVFSARILSPTGRKVDMPIPNSYVGMVDREHFDEWLRHRAAEAGAHRISGTYESFSRDGYGTATLHYRGKDGAPGTLRARCVIAADGAISKLARDTVRGAEKMPYVFAYHEIVRSPKTPQDSFGPDRCDVYYRGTLSPDFYAWVFPHGETTSVGTGSANKGFSLKGSVADLRREAGLDGETIRREGAPIPLKPLKRWDNGRDVVLAGDAAGVVAPASGEGIYYAMLGGRLAADAALAFLKTGDARELAGARKRFMKEHGRVFWVLGIMQYFWYRNDKRRESFVKMCEDKDVQRLTWESYTNKKLVRQSPMAHLRIFVKDMAHLLGIARPT
ncbi:geranylgeranyl diphosphate reductase [Aestuariivirga sp.]|jgi:geranylgeranyl reductase|uniref:geranylgeranyl diphosphate reductase n=1 Tax=Aestuariivirga sp. TaxID=2650926 RepID=UPI00378506C1